MNKLNLLGISVSPRSNGNSTFLLKQAIHGAINVGKENLNIDNYSFRGKHFAPCAQCYQCDGTKGECVIKDCFQELRDKWLAADIVLYSVPIYHFSIPGQLKCFLDRLGQTLSKRYPLKTYGQQALHLKVVGGFAQGMDVFYGQENALLDLVKHALVMNCIPVTCNTAVGVGGWTMLSRDTNKIETLAREGDPLALSSVRAAESIGKRAVQLAMILQAGCRELIDMLKKEDAFRLVLERLDNPN